MSVQDNGETGVLPAKQARSQKRKRVILDAAHRLLETRGYAELKMEDIADAADSSIGTLYQRFSNKEGLLDALLKERQQELAAIIAGELTPEKLTGGRKAAIRRLVQLILEFALENQGFMRAIAYRQLGDPDGIPPLRETARKAVAATWDAIATSDPSCDSEQVRLRFLFGFQLVIGTINNAVLNRPGPVLIDDPRMIDVLTDTIDRLILADDLPL
ncbi:TetR/AcrR family transcriptional regulator [Minwuia sp.]|uniref:TetR/AcrR family transcriptional regulator n=1 Tax=Minwuia sp. TaxID=2493630 RepID=UPI003A939A49